MKKLKLFIYPFVFSIAFFSVYLLLGFILGITLAAGDYAGLAYLFYTLIVWIFVVLPIYCHRYSKLILQDKYKLLLGFYNALVIALCHTGPFLISSIPNGDTDIIIKITLALFGWIAFCTYVSFLFRLNAGGKQDDSNSSRAHK